MIDDDTMIRRNTALPHGEVDGELVALDMARGECFGLDRIGTEIWKMVDTPMTLATLVNTLVDQYEVSSDQCRADVLPFLSQMEKAGLVTVER